MLTKEPVLVLCLGFGMGAAACSSLFFFKKAIWDRRPRSKRRCNYPERYSNHDRHREANVGITGNIPSVNELEDCFFKGIDRKANLTQEQLQALKDFLEGAVGDSVRPLMEAESLEQILHLLRRLDLVKPKRYRMILTILENSRIGVNVDRLTFHVNGLEQAVSDVEDAIVPRGFERDVFELDVLILHTDEDRLEAFQFKKHLLDDGNVRGLSVQLYEEYNVSRPLLSALGDVLNRTRYVFVFMTRRMERDNVQQFMTEMVLLESLNDERKNFRIVPVWTTRERLDVTIMSQFPGLRYWQFTDVVLDLREIYLPNLNRVLLDGREQFVRTLEN